MPSRAAQRTGLTAMNTAHQAFFESAAETILQALGANVVRFVPPMRGEPDPGGTWTEALDLVEEAAEALTDSRRRVAEAETLAQQVSDMAMRELRNAKLRLEVAEADRSES